MLTFHRARNLGASLQAYALNRYINDNIGECEIIDFIPNNNVDNRNNILKLLSKIKKILFFFQYLKDEKFERFRKNNYKLSENTYKGDNDIHLKNTQYDILISGSDQILNTTLTGNSKSFYLAFDKEKKKISYASSFGRENISDTEKRYINEYLPRFDALSVREKSAADILKERINATATLVMDPVFLINANEWRKLKTQVKVPHKYIFVYLMEESVELKQIVEMAKKRFDLPAIVVCGGNETNINAKKIKNCGPNDFISYIDNAELVITNSFHGTAFSLILEKDFICIAHSTRNTRLENILDLCNSNGKMIKSLSDIDVDIDNYLISGIGCIKKLSQHIQCSKDYLIKSCKI